MRTHAQLKSWKRCKCAEIGQLCPSFTLCLVVPCLLPNCSEEAAGPGSLVGVTPPSSQKATRTCRCHLDRLGWDNGDPAVPGRLPREFSIHAEKAARGVSSPALPCLAQHRGCSLSGIRNRLGNRLRSRSLSIYQ